MIAIAIRRLCIVVLSVDELRRRKQVTVTLTLVGSLHYALITWLFILHYRKTKKPMTHVARHLAFLADFDFELGVPIWTQLKNPRRIAPPTTMRAYSKA